MKENLVSKNDRLIVGFLILVFTYFLYFYDQPYIFILIIFLFSLFELFKCGIFKNLYLFIPLLYSPLLLSIFLIENTYYRLIIFISLILNNLILKKYIKEIFIINFFMFFYFIILIIQSSTINVFHIIFIAFFNDTVAFIFGKIIKGPLIIPSVSPKKTWSGTLVSFVLSSLLINIIFDLYFIKAALISISLFFGDIYFSYIKRSMNIKDFSNILKGHGGILDRIDSLFICVSLFYFFNI